VRLRSLVNPAVDPGNVAPPSVEAGPFHAALPGYRPTPAHELEAVARELGLAAVTVKDESDRFGLPAFKVLGASWAVERVLREHPAADTLVAASAGNHGRAVARVASWRGLRCRVFVPARSTERRRRAIDDEGAAVTVVDGDYEEAVAQARAAAAEPGCLEIADVGESSSAHWVIDGYHTLFAEAREQCSHDLILVPVGVGSLAAAAARHAAAIRTGATASIRVIGVEPAAAACLTAALAAGRPTRIPTPGTTMAGLDCAEVSLAAWPSLRDGIHGAITVTDYEAADAMRELADAGLAIGECGAATLAALRALVSDADCESLRRAVSLQTRSRVLLIATEGLTA
jgi:diaminopropionate ammonia-lyase